MDYENNKNNLRVLHLRVRRRGQAMIEMAFVVSILLMLSLGLVQFGIIANTTSSLVNLSREGARYAAVHALENNDGNIRDYVKGVVPPNIDANDVTVTVSPPENDPDRIQGKAITVQVTYDISKKFFLPTNFFGIGFVNGNYSTEGHMMIEAS